MRITGNATQLHICDICGGRAKTHVKGASKTYHVCPKHIKEVMERKKRKRLP